MRSWNAGFARAAFPDAGCDMADVLRRFEGAIERMPGVAASPALGTLIDLSSWRVSWKRQCTWQKLAIYFLRLPSTVRCLGSVSSV